MNVRVKEIWESESKINCIKTSEYNVEYFKPDKDVRLFDPEGFWCFRQYGGPWAKLYKKECFRDIRFPKGIIYEDVFIIYRLIFMQTKLIYLEAPLYFYTIRENSTVTSKWQSMRFWWDWEGAKPPRN